MQLWLSVILSLWSLPSMRLMFWFSAPSPLKLLIQGLRGWARLRRLSIPSIQASKPATNEQAHMPSARKRNVHQIHYQKRWDYWKQLSNGSGSRSLWSDYSVETAISLLQIQSVSFHGPVEPNDCLEFGVLGVLQMLQNCQISGRQDQDWCEIRVLGPSFAPLSRGLILGLWFAENLSPSFRRDFSTTPHATSANERTNFPAFLRALHAFRLSRSGAAVS